MVLYILSCNKLLSADSAEIEYRCYQNRLFLLLAAQSLALEHKYTDNHIISVTNMTNWLGTRNVKLACPLNNMSYPDFTINEGIMCPNGHRFNKGTEIPIKSLLGYIRKTDRSYEEVVKRIESTSSAESYHDIPAISSYYQLNTNRFNDVISKLLGCDDPIKRALVLKQIGELKTFNVNLVIHMLTDSDAFVRKNAIVTIKHIGGKTNLNLIRTMLNDRDQGVSKTAADMVKEIEKE